MASINKIPLISIITPVYNVENYLSCCIQSILDQVFQDWELILIDDGSIDKSGSICDDFAAKDNRIRVVHKENTGQADSRNIALAMVRADLIGFVDSDDWIDANMYKILYEILHDYNADIAICGYFLDYKNQSLPSCQNGDVLLFNQDESLSLILEDKVIKSFPCDKLFRKKCIVTDFPKSFYYEDYATLYKWFSNSQKVAYIRTPLYHYRQRESSTSNDGDPLKNYHFFLAELERYKYSISKPYLSKKRAEFAQKLILVGMRQAKNIAIYSDGYSAGFNYLLKIRNELLKLYPDSAILVKANKRLKYDKFLHFPRYWFYELRFRYKIKFWKKDKKQKYK